MSIWIEAVGYLVFGLTVLYITYRFLMFLAITGSGYRRQQSQQRGGRYE